MKVEFVDNSKQVLSAIEQAESKALTMIGEKQNSIMAGITPVDTGRLRNSRGYEVNATQKVVTVGVTAEYGPWVELGTRRSRAQPYLEPSIMNHREEYRNIVERVMKG
ncbi:hypothetical protein LJC49_07180 [Ruminococcaceae bacterium OttesenSCG-928-I18]|nr:hypothetical protein [Ruminococcaceae bacterium OttesenSCG-928-I18]